MQNKQLLKLNSKKINKPVIKRAKNLYKTPHPRRDKGVK